MSMLIFIFAIGIISGLLTGLLGIGGGLVLVPALMWLLPGTVPDDILMKSSVATAFAVIVFTGAWTAWLQKRAGNFDLPMTLRISAGVAVGALVGAGATAFAPDMALRAFFVLFAVYVGIQMLMPMLPKVSMTFSTRSGLIAGGVTGLVSSLVGVGGATLVVPFLTFCGIDMKKSVAVATGVGVTTAFFSSLGYWWSARHAGVDMPGFIGYVKLGVAGPLIVCCMAGAVGGVACSKYVKAPLLKKMFAFVLLAAAAKMAFSMLA
jgi:uncharacterized membrane protein YfcA